MTFIGGVIKACGRAIPVEIGARRTGDIAVCYADTSKASAELGWRAKRSLDDACAGDDALLAGDLFANGSSSVVYMQTCGDGSLPTPMDFLKGADLVIVGSDVSGLIS